MFDSLCIRDVYILLRRIYLEQRHIKYMCSQVIFMWLLCIYLESVHLGVLCVGICMMLPFAQKLRRNSEASGQLIWNVCSLKRSMHSCAMYILDFFPPRRCRHSCGSILQCFFNLHRCSIGHCKYCCYFRYIFKRLHDVVCLLVFFWVGIPFQLLHCMYLIQKV